MDVESNDDNAYSSLLVPEFRAKNIAETSQSHSVSPTCPAVIISILFYFQKWKEPRKDNFF